MAPGPNGCGSAIALRTQDERDRLFGVLRPGAVRVPATLLAPEGFLAPLLRKIKVEGIDLEAHLRPENEVHVYCGLTCLVKTRLSGSGTSGSNRTRPTPINPERSVCFGRDGPGKSTEVRTRAMSGRSTSPALRRHWRLSWAVCGSRPGKEREGDVQARWSRVTEPWIPFDKEAALAYPSAAERGRQLSRGVSPVGR